ncbi:MAG: PIN domain-containing protein [Tannerella sp.]|jgi:predicted nucleic acid-binding protein|nr:PIN domain-containing protein [Tannerella sp.]
MKVLLDTNVIIDYAAKRMPFFLEADVIFDKIIEKKIFASISANTVTDIFYILKRENNKENTLNFIIELVKIVEILNVNKEIIISALYSGWTDFEDAVQANVALSNDIDYIITRNKKDYEQLIGIEAISPKDFLTRYE